MAASGRQLRLDLDPGRSKQGHGSRACYTVGCRLPACMKANAEYMRQWRSSNPGYVRNRRIVDRRSEYQDRRRKPNGTAQ